MIYYFTFKPFFNENQINALYLYKKFKINCAKIKTGHIQY